MYCTLKSVVIRFVCVYVYTKTYENIIYEDGMKQLWGRGYDSVILQKTFEAWRTLQSQSLSHVPVLYVVLNHMTNMAVVMSFACCAMVCYNWYYLFPDQMDRMCCSMGYPSEKCTVSVIIQNDFFHGIALAIKIKQCPYKKIKFKIPSANWWPFYLGINVLLYSSIPMPAYHVTCHDVWHMVGQVEYVFNEDNTWWIHSKRLWGNHIICTIE